MDLKTSMIIRYTDLHHVEPVTNCHTNTIECTWKHVRLRNRAECSKFFHSEEPVENIMVKMCLKIKRLNNSNIMNVEETCFTFKEAKESILAKMHSSTNRSNKFKLSY
ncbi:hypothetical protein TNIN_389151 [Trichonephila inaurata madagascariensis]|uniref:Uncharacterized protein n=1 Tax=Trichonephila inaurata madagascariensis TaxID=2747483 RepID=A0A8X6YQ47_9ARAC|nr:hypothetical protein TNIN_389151 [Trichonephila inaurata madagascariensis]